MVASFRNREFYLVFFTVEKQKQNNFSRVTYYKKLLGSRRGLVLVSAVQLGRQCPFLIALDQGDLLLSWSATGNLRFN